MSIKISGWDDTIAALATPQGMGAIGVIRVSGKETFEIVNKLFTSKNLLQQSSHTLHGLLHSMKINCPHSLSEKKNLQTLMNGERLQEKEQ